MTGLDPEKHLTIDQTAEALKVSRRTVYRYISEGLIACFKHAGRSYVHAKQIEDYFDRILGTGEVARVQTVKRSRRKS